MSPECSRRRLSNLSANSSICCPQSVLHRSVSLWGSLHAFTDFRRFSAPAFVSSLGRSYYGHRFLTHALNAITNAYLHGKRVFQPTGITSGLPVILPQWATANRERQGALTESRTTIAGDPFYRKWLCGAGQGCRGRILERLYIDNCLALTVELFRQLALSF